jgi:hypothetical protein
MTMAARMGVWEVRGKRWEVGGGRRLEDWSFSEV